MRLFVALDLPADILQRLAAFLRGLQDSTSAARWIPLDQLHVTLKFIGHVEQALLPAIQAALEPLRLPAPLDIGVRGTAFFPSPASPRVLCATVHSSPALPALASSIEDVLDPLGIPRESRAFRPHLTLARFKSGAALSSLRQALAAAGNGDFGSARLSRFRLYQSLLLPAAAQYVPLADFTFYQAGL